MTGRGSRQIPIALAVAALVSLSGCGGAGADESSFGTFVGARARAVWVQQQKAGQIDKHAAGGSLKLMGLDSADGRGARAILDKVGSYARPLFTPDGGQVVFSDKGVDKKSSGKRRFRPRCFVVGFDGSGLRELGAGFAEALWRDPASGAVWVYVVDGIKPAKTTIMQGTRLERFRLDAPGERETVWERSEVGAGSFRLSRDGAKMVGLFPWPDAGVVDRESGAFTRIGSGCWTSIAPDESGVAWVFEGAHQNVDFYTPDGKPLAKLALNGHPDLARHRVYHPRWTNHPRFAVLTGPYLAKQKAGADKIEVYLAKFAADLKSVEAWHRLTDNARADLYPDVWIEGGEKVALDLDAASSGVGDPPATRTWPAPREGLVFAWRDSRESIEVGGKFCRVVAKGAARYGRRFDLAPGEGYFVAESVTAADLDACESLTIEAVLTPAPEDGTVLQFGARHLRQVGGRLQWGAPAEGGGEQLTSFGELTPGVPLHLVLGIAGGELVARIDGEPVEAQRVAEPVGLTGGEPVAELRFGGGWHGRLERLAIYEGAVDVPPPGELRREPVAGRAKVVGKLVEVTRRPEVDEIGTYRRALVYHLYEIESVESGEFGEGRVAVGHWVILDRIQAAGLPEEIGASYPLTIDPLGEHPELRSERSFNELSDVDAKVYFDISPPKIQRPE